MSEREILELERLEREATPAPWEYDHSGIGHPCGPPEYVCDVVALKTEGSAYMQYETLVLSASDGAFIASARNLIPDLIKGLRDANALSQRFQAESERAREALREIGRVVHTHPGSLECNGCRATTDLLAAASPAPDTNAGREG